MENLRDNFQKQKFKSNKKNLGRINFAYLKKKKNFPINYTNI